jgi:hypothetical protein
VKLSVKLEVVTGCSLEETNCGYGDEVEAACELDQDEGFVACGELGGGVRVGRDDRTVCEANRA